MPVSLILCARCSVENHPSSRFCTHCGLPLGVAEPDAEAALDALGPYEAPDPADPDTSRIVRAFVDRAGYPSKGVGHGYRLVVPMPLDRRQAVYVGSAGLDPEGRAMVALVSVCGSADQRDARGLLKLNAVAVEGHFAIKVLRGEEYYVVIRTLAADAVAALDAEPVIRRIAALADGLEDRLSRGRDLF